MKTDPTRTTVAIIGAGPAGLMLARLLHKAGIDSVVLENRDRAYIEQRQRAGILEQGTVDALRACGAGERMDREGLVHHGVELRFDRRGHRIDFPSLTGGRSVMVYAQTEMVKDLVALQLAEGGPLLFEAQAIAIEGLDDGGANGRAIGRAIGRSIGDPNGADGAEGANGGLAVRFTHEGRERTLSADFVVGCDGFHGIARAAVPGKRTFEREYPFSWLGILADVAPSCDELIYAHSERGFALHSMRSTSVSRLYLQVPNGTDPMDWPDEKIWDELEARFAIDADWKLERGPITQKSVTPMRSFVTEPMAYGRLFLAGDAAHIVPPTGAKGLNLAVSDVIILARALERWHQTGSADLLDAYSDTCLRRVWRAEHFSYFMTTLLHADPGQSDFDSRLQLSQLHRIADSPHAAAELAENYVGLPLT